VHQDPILNAQTGETCPCCTCCSECPPCSNIMLANKAAGKANWYHPASLTSGGRYANGSAPLRCIHAASGMLASSWHMTTSRRQAEAFRWRWSLTGIEGVSEECIPPVWGVGMAGLLRCFQEAQGTGFYMVNWGCKVNCRIVDHIKSLVAYQAIACSHRSLLLPVAGCCIANRT